MWYYGGFSVKGFLSFHFYISSDETTTKSGKIYTDDGVSDKVFKPQPLWYDGMILIIDWWKGEGVRKNDELEFYGGVTG